MTRPVTNDTWKLAQEICLVWHEQGVEKTPPEVLSEMRAVMARDRCPSRQALSCLLGEALDAKNQAE